MSIKSISEYVKYDPIKDLYDFFEPIFETRASFINDVKYNEYKVSKYEDMRIDEIFRQMYGLNSITNDYLGDIDIILFINNIDNPLNIKEGYILKYPVNINDLSKFRVTPEQKEQFDKSVINKLVVPNKSTRKDSSREKFKENSYLLPPVVLDSPKPPVTVTNGKFTIGGL